MFTTRVFSVRGDGSSVPGIAGSSQAYLVDSEGRTRFHTPDTNHILFTADGWPWAMDGDGTPAASFVPPAASRQPEMVNHPQARADDMGYGFDTKVVDWSSDGTFEAVIYDRRYLWSFPLD